MIAPPKVEGEQRSPKNKGGKNSLGNRVPGCPKPLGEGLTSRADAPRADQVGGLQGRVQQLGAGMVFYLHDCKVFPGHPWILSRPPEMRIHWFNAMVKMLAGYKVEGCEHRGYPRKRQSGTLRTSTMDRASGRRSLRAEHLEERAGAALILWIGPAADLAALRG